MSAFKIKLKPTETRHVIKYQTIIIELYKLL